ncbi:MULTISPECIES: esterase family protein [unclassified Bacillus (in: firmicutes)]|uniref:esterase family protein n=1 Tax=unclassified Bacillus (in: firmicutes) TaxID=185979 RepID=UPI000478E6AB|nr:MULTISPECIES: esterase family protein [unclassified Bacillus (in: firmicutes)]QHZ46295.1 esterase family protein [Bacillus sp. NSP9.1]WFA06518.1 esterase family protein [Bacillus sp. HSf4]
MAMKTGVIQEKKLFSKELGEEMELLVYLPASYSPLYKYHVIIAQDGHDYFRLGRISRQLEELLNNGEIERSIIIGVPYKNVQERRLTYHPEGSKFEAYKRFLAHELVPFADREYPTYQVGSGRTLIGDSLGGTVSLMTALDYPNMFGNVIMQSPYVDDHVLDKVLHSDSLQLISICHQIGTKETEVHTTDEQILDFTKPNQKLKDLLQQKKADYDFETFDGDHKWTYWQPLITPALKKML